MDAYHSQRGQGPQKGQNDHDTREPDALKGARPVRRGAVRKGLTGDTTLSETGMVYGSISTSLAAYSTKLVIAALEWSYEAKATDVQAEWLEQAAELLVLRYDTFWIIDGEGPGIETDQARASSLEQTSETQAEQISSPNEEQKTPLISLTEQAAQAHSKSGVQSEPNQSAKCTFFGVVSIDLKRFEESGVSLVECPGCRRTWTLAPRSGVLRFKSHDKRKTNTPNTGRRWARGERETDWDVVEGGAL
jgi:hypothetical protein